jgi:hypothetical protein
MATPTIGSTLVFPRLAVERAARVCEARLPTSVDSLGSEVDVSGVVLTIEPWGIELDDVHDGAATVTSELLDFGGLTLGFRHPTHKFSNHMAKLMNLHLTRDLAVARLAY